MSKIEAGLNNNVHCETNNAIDKPEKKVKAEYLIVKCKDAFTNVVDEIEKVFDLAPKTEVQDGACQNLEDRFEKVTKRNDEFFAAAHVNIDLVQDKET